MCGDASWNLKTRDNQCPPVSLRNTAIFEGDDSLVRFSDHHSSQLRRVWVWTKLEDGSGRFVGDHRAKLG